MQSEESVYEDKTRKLILLAAEISAALWVHLRIFETTLRSFIHDVLSLAYKSDEWWLVPELLSSRDLRDIHSAKRRLEYQKRNITPFLVINNMSLSFWVELLGFRYYKQVWVHLAKALPHYNGSREDFYNKAREIRNLRNSIAHHGPIMRRNLIRDHAYLGELTAILDPELAREVEKRSRVLDLLLNARLVGSGGGI